MTEFTLRQLAYFVAVAEEGTLTDAATRLHVSASALSAALTDLETSLGVQLCVRRKARGVTLTPSGVHLLDQARTVLKAAGEVRYLAGMPGGELRGPVTIGCYPTLAPTVLPRLLDGVARKHQHLTLTIVEAPQDSLQRGLEDGSLDLSIDYDLQLGGGPNRVLLYEARAHVLLPAEHPLAEADAVRLEQLMQEPFILLDIPPSTDHTRSLFAELGGPPPARHRSTSYETVRALVGRGLGWSVLVQRPANALSYEGLPVVVKEIEPRVLPIGVHLTWPGNLALSPRARAVVDVARALSWPLPSA